MERSRYKIVWSEQSNNYEITLIKTSSRVLLLHIQNEPVCALLVCQSAEFEVCIPSESWNYNCAAALESNNE